VEQVSRRAFLLRSGGALVSGAALGVGGAANATAAEVTDYPRESVAHLASLAVGVPHPFTYPDAASPCLLLRLGRPVAAGVGPQGDLLAFSALCPHMGCALSFDAQQARLLCPCHFSSFDCEQEGAQICGQATQPVARIQLAYDSASETVQAVGVAGTLYGRRGNLAVGGQA